MATQEFNVTIEEGSKAIPLGTKKITKNEDGEAWIVEGDPVSATGKHLMGYIGLPYELDPAVQYYVVVENATFSGAID